VKETEEGIQGNIIGKIETMDSQMKTKIQDLGNDFRAKNSEVMDDLLSIHNEQQAMMGQLGTISDVINNKLNSMHHDMDHQVSDIIEPKLD
jgi:hypothetical protein